MTARAQVETISFGCRLNLVESEAMRRAALAGGHDRLAIFNTCAVTAEASRQARQAIRKFKREHPELDIVVTGCGAEIDPESFAQMPEVETVFGNKGKTDPAHWQALGMPRMGSIMGETKASTILAEGIEDHTRAFLPIQNGCDHRCSFCIIPFGRGPSRSVPLRQVLDAALRLCDQGFNEIVLTGVDLTAYGADLDEKTTLGRLIRQILQEAPGLARLRLSSVDCIEADPDLIEAMATEQRLMPHLHLSLQSGDDLILKRMKRRHTRQDAVDFCAMLRRYRKDIVFGADMIAGFPTETEAMFENSLALVKDCGLTYLHVFPFSARPGTPAAKMPPVNGADIKQRARYLREAGDFALKTHLRSQIGKVLPVLSERGGKGRTPDFSYVHIADAPAGQIFDYLVEGDDGKELFGKVLSF